LRGARAWRQEPYRCVRSLAAAFGDCATPRELVRGVHQEGRFSDARLAADENNAAGDDAAAEDAIELTPAQWHARRIFRADLAERQRAGRLMGSGSRVSGCLPDLELLQRVPGPAMWTLAGPANALAPAFGAHKGDGRFGHRQAVYP